MELEEAKEILGKFANNEIQRDKLERDNRCGGWKIGDIYKHLELNTAIETALQALDNSIPKEKVENKIKKLQHKDFIKLQVCYKHDNEALKQLEVLKELLEE